MKQSPKQPAKKRRAQLIKAAERVFARKGYAGATTEEIARTAGLTKGALYFHFRNKEDVFFAVVKEVNDSIARKITRALDEEANPEKAIEKAIQSAFKLIEDHKFLTVEFWQKAHTIRRVKDFLAEEHKNMQNQIVRFLQKSGDLKKRECDSFFTLLHAIFDGLMVRQTCYGGEDDLRGLSKQVVEITKLYLKKNKLKLG
ncbi:MAG: TetR/AcrR family transcriptional regulator [Candidatus Zixiibacteriota bacterium]|nr:MAG: TetR/AcrR family transcriptional regulator [candidate division Zixibacteria bacterium]